MGALETAVTGLKVHQTMLDVAGNNLANVNTIGYKATSTSFSELLSQTIKKSSAPAGNLGGTNPQQVGTGVGLATITRDMSQGTFIATGQNLDAAISGSGYFVLRNAEQQSVYTRMGSFSVDSGNNLVDVATGYKVQRTGTYGAVFQGTGTDITIPFGFPMQANDTNSVTLAGNLRSEVPSTVTDAATTNVLTFGQAYTDSAVAVSGTADLSAAELDQFTGGPIDAGGSSIAIIGTNQAGGSASGSFALADGDTMQDVLDGISGLYTGSTATLNTSGQIVLTDDTAGFSETEITSMVYTASGAGESFTMPTTFTLTTAGGNDTQTVVRDIYDALGTKHTMSGILVKTDTANTWDLVIPVIAGETAASALYDTRRIEGIQFDPSSGAYNGLADPATSLTFSVVFTSNPTVTQDITLDLGTVGQLDGLTQFGATSSNAAISLQDGYTAGILSEVSIDDNGMVIGKFTNDKTMVVAAVQLGVFQNPGALEALGSGYYAESANSGVATATVAGANGAGSLKGGQLEQSNTDVAKEFVNLMKAQNGFQSNARTVRVANDILRELTSLIR